MITMTVAVRVRSEKREEFLQTMRSLNANGEKQKGLRRFTLYHQIDDPTGFSLIYEWEAQEDLERYLGEEKFRVLLGALKVLGKNSEIRYEHFSEKYPDLACGAHELWSEHKIGSEYF